MFLLECGIKGVTYAVFFNVEDKFPKPAFSKCEPVSCSIWNHASEVGTVLVILFK